MGVYFKWDIDRIYLYPYGGLTKFNNDLNVDMKEELLVLLMGPIFQIIATLIIILIINNYKSIITVSNYSISLLLFNLIPIYPLDGGRLLNLLFNKFLSYKFSLILSLVISLIIIIFVIIFSIKYYLRLNFIFIFIFLLVKVYEEIKKVKYYYNKFVLERYLNNYKFKKYKRINNINNMMRNKKHIFYINNKYITEKEALKKIYKNS